jgi:3-oxoacyl-(acyl-carrier-protein) synthase
MLLQTGKADIMVTGGTETPIAPMTFAGFDAMRVMSVSNHSPKNASRPFDANRDGFVMGEGACMLMLETESNAKKRGARIYAELAGYAANNGGYHMVIPMPDGSDAAAVMRLALEDARLSLDDIDYINAHGTSTQANDLSETKAIKAVWGKKANQLAISSTKGATGHLLGATGAIEAAFTALSIYHGQIPPTANYETSDTNCDLDYTPITRSKNVRAALSNSFGFGNNNACLVFKKWN